MQAMKTYSAFENLNRSGQQSRVFAGTWKRHSEDAPIEGR